jgi:3-oxoacyl-[acyl-carrier-protein] synthase II
MSSAKERVVVTGVGIVTPVAEDSAALHAAARNGRSPGARQPEMAIDGMAGPLAAPHAEFDARAELGRANLRPLDRTGRLTAAAALRALTASGWSEDDLADHEVGLVLGTLFGSVQTISGFDRRGVSAGPSYAKPMDFANSVINAAAGQTAIRFDLRGVNATISGDLTAGLQALGYAADCIRSGRSEAVLAGGVDELCVESIYGFHKMRLLCPTGVERAVPLAGSPTGMVPAESAALLMLESRASATRRGAPIVAEILGHGSAFDPARGAEASGSATSVTQAVAAALADAGRSASAVDCVSAGANGTGLDEAELEGLANALDSPRPVPTLAAKATTGETLGAAGALQTVLAVESLRRRLLPGVPGLTATEHRRNLEASAENSPLSGSTALMTAVGLQGKAAALVAEAVH